jgi:uncharacterized protein (DUF488 family)
VEIYTIGFTKKNAKEFFSALRGAGIRRLIDVRLNNTSQLAGFAKRDDLEFFLRELCGAEYWHEPSLAPTEEMLNAYKKKQLPWEEYELRFVDLLVERKVEQVVDRQLFETRAVLLCSEPSSECCHRRLAAEYLAGKWGGVEIVHL